ncbi:UNVERIFIED_CONTAM: hypothetical protein Sradi_4349900 [Sesamum radiatum]|uniref:RNase H type-1 domain-containing protein n=1 Tax=Sesamum radiatum TaxID=300843 RepID=A0AAW2NRN8_SESRA
MNNSNISSKKRTFSILCNWQPPPTEWFKLNIDGSSLGNPGKSGYGGIIRDEAGNIIVAFSGYIGNATNNVAECWALRNGLDVARKYNCRNIIIETDSKTLLHLLRREDSAPKVLIPLLRDSRKLLQEFGSVKATFCYREVNRTADLLARSAAVNEDPMQIFLQMPPFVHEFVMTDPYYSCTRITTSHFVMAFNLQ